MYVVLRWRRYVSGRSSGDRQRDGKSQKIRYEFGESAYHLALRQLYRAQTRSLLRRTLSATCDDLPTSGNPAPSVVDYTYTADNGKRVIYATPSSCSSGQITVKFEDPTKEDDIYKVRIVCKEPGKWYYDPGFGLWEPIDSVTCVSGSFRRRPNGGEYIYGRNISQMSVRGPVPKQTLSISVNWSTMDLVLFGSIVKMRYCSIVMPLLQTSYCNKLL